MLRSLSDSADAVGACVAELDAGTQGFPLLRALWQQRDDDAASLRSVAQQVREAACRDLGRGCDRHVLALSATAQFAAGGRRARTMFRRPCGCRIATASRWPPP